MLHIGYKLSSEEHAPNDLVRYAVRAEQAGFSFAMILGPFPGGGVDHVRAGR